MDDSNSNDEGYNVEYHVLPEGDEVVNMYDHCLNFLDESIKMYSDPDNSSWYSPSQVISGLTHCMLKVMYSNMGAEVMESWLKNVMELQQSHVKMEEDSKRTVHSSDQIH